MSAARGPTASANSCETSQKRPSASIFQTKRVARRSGEKTKAPAGGAPAGTDAGAADVSGRGPLVETDPLFPERTNVEFASLSGPDRLRMRVWERGAGITLACGSGACATAVAAHLRGLTGRRVTLDLDGGVLEIDWREDGVWMAGPVALVFEGQLSPAFLASLAGASLAGVSGS